MNWSIDIILNIDINLTHIIYIVLIIPVYYKSILNKIIIKKKNRRIKKK